MFYGQPMVKGQTHAQLGVIEIVTLEFAYLAAICTVDMFAAVAMDYLGIPNSAVIFRTRASIHHPGHILLAEGSTEGPQPDKICEERKLPCLCLTWRTLYSFQS
jgi:hypothetical protein